MYLLPLLYGLFLRWTFYRDIPVCARSAGTVSLPKTFAYVLRAASLPAESRAEVRNARGTPSLLEQTQASITSALVSIGSLGGYMILFNLMNLIPDLLLPVRADTARALCACLLEITSGLSGLGPANAFCGFVLLPFGGLSCIAQTYSMIQETDLFLRQYVLHKCIQTLLAFLYYTALFPGLF